MNILFAFYGLFAFVAASFDSQVPLADAAVDFTNWHPPTTNDLRSPCPALNALANHGILPRDGRNLTVPLLIERLGAALKFTPEMAATVATDGMRTSSDPASGSYTLGDLNKHNVVEHDGSLSREDVKFVGEGQRFSPEVFEETLSYFEGKTEVGVREVAAARWGRIQASKATNPQFAYGPGAQRGSYLESAIYHQVLKDPVTQKASVEWIKTLFSEERFPYSEGWRPVNRVDGVSLITGVFNLAMHTPEKAPGVHCVGEGSNKE